MSVQLIWNGKLRSCQDWFHFPSNLWYETMFLCMQMEWRSSLTFMVLSFVSTSSCILFSTVFFDLLVFDIFSFSFLCNSECFSSKESFSAHEHKNPRGDFFFFTICLKPFKFDIFDFCLLFWLGYPFYIKLHVHKSVTKIVSNQLTFSNQLSFGSFVRFLSQHYKRFVFLLLFPV